MADAPHDLAVAVQPRFAVLLLPPPMSVGVPVRESCRLRILPYGVLFGTVTGRIVAAG
jgi:hypothetical protein